MHTPFPGLCGRGHALTRDGHLFVGALLASLQRAVGGHIRRQQHRRVELVRVRVPACGPRCLAGGAKRVRAWGAYVLICHHRPTRICLLPPDGLASVRPVLHVLRVVSKAMPAGYKCMSWQEDRLWEAHAWHTASGNRRAHLEVAHAPFIVLVGVQVVSLVLQHGALGRCICWCCCRRRRRLRCLQRHESRRQ